MRKSFTRWLLLPIIATTAFCSLARAEQCAGTPTQEEALRAEDARYAAQLASDVSGMSRIFGTDLVYVHSTAAINDKKVLLETLGSGAMRYTVLQRSDASVRIFGCVGIITGILDAEAQVRGSTIKARLRFHSVWVKRESGMEWVSFQGTVIPEKK